VTGKHGQHPHLFMMSQVVTSVSKLPNLPALYAMYGGRGSGLYVAYVGIAGTSLRGRVEQHLIRRDSSVTTGVAAVSLNPDAVTEVRWWTHERFGARLALEAAELVAFDVLNPALRSRGTVSAQAKALYGDSAFVGEVRELLSGKPAGILILPSLVEALARITSLEERIAAIEAQLGAAGESSE
jgi:hypothetical protein